MMIDIQSILGEYLVMSDGSPDMAWIVSALVLLMFIYFVGLTFVNVVKALLK